MSTRLICIRWLDMGSQSGRWVPDPAHCVICSGGGTQRFPPPCFQFIKLGFGVNELESGLWRPAINIKSKNPLQSNQYSSLATIKDDNGVDKDEMDKLFPEGQEDTQ